MRRSRNAGGFTLIELMAAMALLSAMGALLVQLVRSSFDMYQEGDLRGDLYANAMPIMEMIEDDLSAVHGGAAGRLLLRTDLFTGRRGHGFLLRLVRTIPGGEQNHPVLRRAGGVPSAEGVYLGSDPGAAERKAIAPPSGLMEVAYALIQEETDPEGLFALYRGERAPVHAPQGFFDAELEGSWDEERVRRELKPVAADILGLWVMCLPQGALDWSESEALESAREASSSSI
ncbi:MAG TPA: type II secretion system protein, partial [Planctomycetota bacterium]|nr:type II secretion system protein [Planctomycetota bacterium]